MLYGRMRIPLDRASATPLYRQIVSWLRRNIESGSLAPETKLPASRALADLLGVSRITVKNAYAVLEVDGFIVSREGSGTYVARPLLDLDHDPRAPEPAWPPWQQSAVADVQSESPRMPAHGRADTISFTGVADPRLFPLAEFANTLRDVLRRRGTEALGYGSFGRGFAPLRETIVHILASQGIRADMRDVLVTAGSQQALSLVCGALLRPGDVVVVEEPTYNNALGLFRTLGLRVVSVPLDSDGVRTDLLETVLRRDHPSLIYTIPNFQNPSGATLSGDRRRELLSLAERYNVPIVEDDYAGDLRFEGRTQPAIKALDPGGRVIYLGTFSKMLMPGLRVGYLIVEGPVMEKLVRRKEVTELTTSPLMERAVNEFVTVGRYQAHLRRTTRLYRRRRDAILEAIAAHLPACSVEHVPKGGLFLWLRLPTGRSASGLLPRAIEHGVEFAPGTRFFADPRHGEPFVRLNLAVCTPEEAEEGVYRFATALRS